MSDLYNQRGVSSQKEDVLEAIKHLDKGLYTNTFCKILPDYVCGDEAYVNIMHADTAGTKSILAYLYWKETGDLSIWKHIAQDAMVMNLDDMVCSGATNHFILSSTIARNKHLIPKEVLSAVINGCNELLQEWKELGVHIHHAGGETADVGDLVKTIDVGYTAFARFPKQDVITVNPQPGDVIVGFASFGQASYEIAYNSGIGCNGLTSARHDILNKTYLNFTESYDQQLNEAICYIGKYRLTDTLENGMQIGKLLLSPTRTFVPVLIPILQAHRSAIRGIIHNTGGGQTKCMKYIPGNVKVIKNNLFEPPIIFNLIQEASGISKQEMYEVFNMGTRLEIYTDEVAAQQMIEIAKQFNIEAQVVGRFEASDKKELILEGI
ncbi:MAG: phosphoribosylformylglycinamidine cyclo-ligase [Chitinophagaceae bacterium]|nr:phosphoribosylformylglycinamidine cyclo-ligase [Chitinophagaceae bacterium]